MKKGAHNTYWGNIREGITSLLDGLRLTFRHFLQARHSRKSIGVEDPEYFKEDKGIVTLEYPHESIPIPDNGRYRLHNEIDDCIVCDLCAKICPVNCIEIEPVKSTEEIGKTSDGTTKRLYAARFDIDMAKCCYCGLCTTVCPTECLTMTKTYDYSEYDIRNMVYHFTDLTPGQAEAKKKEYEEHQKQKASVKTDKNKGDSSAEALSTEKKDASSGTTGTEPKKPAFKPTIKIPGKKTETDKSAAPADAEKKETDSQTQMEATKGQGAENASEQPGNSSEIKSAPQPKKPVIRPVIKVPAPKKSGEEKSADVPESGNKNSEGPQDNGPESGRGTEGTENKSADQATENTDEIKKTPEVKKPVMKIKIPPPKKPDADKDNKE